MTTKKYQQFNMTTAQSCARLTSCIEHMYALELCSIIELAARMGLKKATMVRFVSHLCEEGVFRVAVPSVRCEPALYEMSPDYVGTGYDPVAAAEADTEPMVRRSVPADGWPRGEHAYRSGLLAVMFPFAAEA